MLKSDWLPTWCLLPTSSIKGRQKKKCRTSKMKEETKIFFDGCPNARLTERGTYIYVDRDHTPEEVAESDGLREYYGTTYEKHKRRNKLPNPERICKIRDRFKFHEYGKDLKGSDWNAMVDLAKREPMASDARYVEYIRWAKRKREKYSIERSERRAEARAKRGWAPYGTSHRSQKIIWAGYDKAKAEALLHEREAIPKQTDFNVSEIPDSVNKLIGD